MHAWRGASCALTVLVAAACGTATSQESQEQVYDRPGIPNYQQAKAQTLDHRVALFYDRVYWSGAEALAGAQFASSVDALAAEIEAQVRSVAEAVAPRSGSGGGGGPVGACGGSKYDYVIDEENRHGDPNLYNTGGSGAWGCYQIMPGTWAGAGCNEFGQHGSASAEAQARCADRLSPSDWAASQG